MELKNNEFDFILKTNLPPSQGIFYDGQIFDAYVFISKIIKSAQMTQSIPIKIIIYGINSTTIQNF
jgi:hypothetical protein